ncbi:hypothetical protein ACVWXL_009045 [Bradyrhizobium sp. GM22.5]
MTKAARDTPCSGRGPARTASRRSAKPRPVRRAGLLKSYLGSRGGSCAAATQNRRKSPTGGLHAERFSTVIRWSFQCTTWCQTRGFLQPASFIPIAPQSLLAACNGTEAMPEFDWRSPDSYKSLEGAEIADIACNADYRRDYEAMVASSPDGQAPPSSGGGGASAFARDPQRSFDEQIIFWAPEVLTAVVPVTVGSAADRSSASQPLLDVTASQVRRAADGWRAVLRIGAVDHHVWSKEPPVLSAAHVVELPFDNDLEARAYAARRLWRAMNGRAPGPAFHKLSSRP